MTKRRSARAIGQLALALALLLCLPAAQADSPATTRVSVDSSGAQGDGHSYDPSISADGRYVAFQSYATNPMPPTIRHQMAPIHPQRALSRTGALHRPLPPGWPPHPG